MSKISLTPNASGTGNFTIASPNSNTDRTLTLPDATGTINTSGAVNEVPAGTASAPSIYPTGDTNTGMFFPAADTIAFSEGGAEAMRIDSSGNVGISNTNPRAPLAFAESAGTAGEPNKIRFYDNGGVVTYGIGISNAQQNYVVAGGGAHCFYVGDLGSATERMRIDSSGNVLVGTTSANGRLTVSSPSSDTVAASITNTSASPYGLLTDFSSDPNNATNYGYKFRLTNNTNIYTIFSNGTTSARSDERFKKDIETTRDGYAEDLSKLRVVKYRWHNAEENSPKELGFIAQEVEQVFPNLISTEVNDDGIDVKSIKTSVFIPMLIKAIQEQQTIIETLKVDIAELKAKVNV